MLGMSRSVQTITFMPLASVVACTWSAPGTRGAGAGAGLLAATAAQVNKIAAAPVRNFGMSHLETEVRNLPSRQKESAANGGSRLRREEANTGEELFAVLVEARFAALPRNPGGVDRGELGPGQSR